MEKIIVFGAGELGSDFIQHKSKNQIILAVTDNNPEKHNSEIMGYPVIRPADLGEYEFQRIMIASIHYPAIYEQLLQIQIDPEKIMIHEKTVISVLPWRFYVFISLQIIAMIGYCLLCL